MIHCNPFYIQLLFDTVLKDMDSYDLLKLLVDTHLTTLCDLPLL